MVRSSNSLLSTNPTTPRPDTKDIIDHADYDFISEAGSHLMAKSLQNEEGDPPHNHNLNGHAQEEEVEEYIEVEDENMKNTAVEQE
jgi:hypothetical protein